jgi:hypothetical protein
MIEHNECYASAAALPSITPMIVFTRRRARGDLLAVRW